MAPDVHLISQAGPAFTTITSGLVPPLHYIYGDSSTATTLLQGFSFTGGYPGYGFGGMVHLETNHEVENCVFENIFLSPRTAVIWMDGEGRVANCEFRDIIRASDFRIGRTVLGVQCGWRSNVVVENCRFQDNRGTQTVSVDAGYQGTTIVRNCEFVGLHAQGVRQESTELLVTGCLFEENAGRCFRIVGSGVAEIRGNTFVNNSFIAISTVNAQASVIIDNNVFWNNAEATRFDGGVFTIRCNVLWQNGIDWQGIEDQTGLNGNVVADPLFCDAGGGVYTVATNSPCLPDHSNVCGLIGAFGQGCGVVSIESLSWAGVKALYR
jgi:hypothetical protein